MRSLILFAAFALALSGLAGVVAVDDRDRPFSTTGGLPDSVKVEGKEVVGGFHRVQSMAWHGHDLWISNAPDLTIVRDLNGDGVADQYVQMGRSLGDEEHGLKGIAWGADGKLYMATDEPGLMPAGQLGRPMMYHKGEYSPVPFRRAAGGTAYKGTILRCDADGRGLEVVERDWAGDLQEVRFDDSFRLIKERPAATSPNTSADGSKEDKLQRPTNEWTFEELAEDLGHRMAARSVAAQEELVRRGESVKVGMLEWLKRDDLTQRQRTWALWTLGRVGKDDVEIEAWFAAQPVQSADGNTRIQSLRIIAFRMQEFGFSTQVPESVVKALRAKDSEERRAAVEVLRRCHQSQQAMALVELVAVEDDAETFAAACMALEDFADSAMLQRMRSDDRSGVKAALKKIESAKTKAVPR